MTKRKASLSSAEHNTATTETARKKTAGDVRTTSKQKQKTPHDDNDDEDDWDTTWDVEQDYELNDEEQNNATTTTTTIPPAATNSTPASKQTTKKESSKKKKSSKKPSSKTPTASSSLAASTRNAKFQREESDDLSPKRNHGAGSSSKGKDAARRSTPADNRKHSSFGGSNIFDIVEYDHASTIVRRTPDLEDAEVPQDHARFRYTSYPIFPIIHIKNVSGIFRREEKSHLVSAETRASVLPNPEREGSDTIVIHPGSRYLRIGRALDTYPITIPHVIARKLRKPASSNRPSPPKVNIAEEPRPRSAEGESAPTEDIMDEGGLLDQSPKNDKDLSSADAALNAIELNLKRRSRAAKRRTVPNATYQVQSYNASSLPETILDYNDPYRVDWTSTTDNANFYIGDKALRLPDSVAANYDVRWPIQNGSLNIDDGKTLPECVGDLCDLWSKAMIDELNIEPSQFKNLNATLVVPDTFNKRTVLEMTSGLHQIGFRGVLIHQESVSATIGAGISTACVVDIGAQKTSIACVEDGLICAETRMSLPYGGDDLTRLFAKLMRRASFPYKELDLNRMHDWMLMQELKERVCTSNEAHLSIQVHEFSIRLCDKPTLKYNVKAYAEAAIAPMALFYPQAFEQENQPQYTIIVPDTRYAGLADDNDELSGAVVNPSTSANANASGTKKEATPAPPPPTASQQQPNVDASFTNQNGTTDSKPPQTNANTNNNTTTTTTTTTNPTPAAAASSSSHLQTPSAAFEPASSPAPPAIDATEHSSSEERQPDTSSSSRYPNGRNDTPLSSSQNQIAIALENADGDGAEISLTKASSSSSAPAASASASNSGSGSKPTTNVARTSEFSPIDHAVVASIAASSTLTSSSTTATTSSSTASSTSANNGVAAAQLSEERIKKLFGSILMVGGGGTFPMFSKFLEERISQIVPYRFPSIDKIEVLPSPRDMDPRLLSWKGAAVFSKLDAAKDMWMGREEFDVMQDRLLKERAGFVWG